MWDVKKNCSESIAALLRDDMAAGHYRAGERLPSVDDLRARFGAGEFAVRHALQRLRDEGFIYLKQRMGAVATEKCAIPWKGRVAFITASRAASEDVWFHGIWRHRVRRLPFRRCWHDSVLRRYRSKGSLLLGGCRQ